MKILNPYLKKLLTNALSFQFHTNNLGHSRSSKATFPIHKLILEFNLADSNVWVCNRALNLFCAKM